MLTQKKHPVHPEIPQEAFRADIAPTPSGAGVDKVLKYGWEIVDSRGRFDWLPKAELRIDHEYQRNNVNNKRVLRLAQSWSWVACGVLVVGRRPDGTYWVMDGQHRKLAADKRSDISTLPCLVFEVTGKAQEAQGFLAVNTDRGPVPSLSKFNAQVMARDPQAVAVKAMVEADGYTVKKGAASDGVACVGSLMSALASDAGAARIAWGLCVRLYAALPIDQRGSVQDKVFGSLFAAERFLKARRAGSLADPNNAEVLLRHTPADVLRSVNQSTSYHGGGAKAWAEGLIRLLNKRRTTRRLPEPYAGTDD